MSFIAYRCINRLCDLHVAVENFTEAGYTALKHAELLKVINLLLISTKTLSKILLVKYISLFFHLHVRILLATTD